MPLIISLGTKITATVIQWQEPVLKKLYISPQCLALLVWQQFAYMPPLGPNLEIEFLEIWLIHPASPTGLHPWMIYSFDPSTCKICAEPIRHWRGFGHRVLSQWRQTAEFWEFGVVDEVIVFLCLSQWPLDFLGVVAEYEGVPPSSLCFLH